MVVKAHPPKTRAAQEADDSPPSARFIPASAKHVEVVDVPSIQFLMIDGAGDPNTSAAYQGALEALYSVSYALKFAAKKREGRDYRVSPLEGLWWAEGMAETPFSDLLQHKDRWQWTMMIGQPESVMAAQVAAAIDQVRRKRALPALEQLRLEHFHEGLAAQVLHIGPYAAEGPTIERLHTFIRDQGYRPRGKHHEIYLGDPRRTQPGRLRTVLRQPIERWIADRSGSVDSDGRR